MQKIDLTSLMVLPDDVSLFTNYVRFWSHPQQKRDQMQSSLSVRGILGDSSPHPENVRDILGDSCPILKIDIAHNHVANWCWLMLITFGVCVIVINDV